MQSGKLVEHADTETVFEHPQQEYTQALLNAIPGAGLVLSGDR
jgi:peptide/nickel transport system ATP-binding protein